MTAKEKMDEKKVVGCPVCGEGHWTKLPDGLNLCIECRRDRVAFWGLAYAAALAGPSMAGCLVSAQIALADYDAHLGIKSQKDAEPGCDIHARVLRLLTVTGRDQNTVLVLHLATMGVPDVWTVAFNGTAAEKIIDPGPRQAVVGLKPQEACVWHGAGAVAFVSAQKWALLGPFAADRNAESKIIAALDAAIVEVLYGPKPPNSASSSAERGD